MDQPEYTTNDPYLASFVVCEGGALAGCRRLGPKKVEFRFVADRRLHKTLRVYWSRLPVYVTPYRLYAALRILKSRTLVQPGIDTSGTTVLIGTLTREDQPETRLVPRGTGDDTATPTTDPANGQSPSPLVR